MGYTTETSAWRYAVAERREVCELQHGRHHDVRPHGRVGVEAPERDGGEEDDRRDERDRRRRFRVPLAAEDQVPERVEEGRPEREGEGVQRHGRVNLYRAARLPARDEDRARARLRLQRHALARRARPLSRSTQELFAEYGRPLTEATTTSSSRGSRRRRSSAAGSASTGEELAQLIARADRAATAELAGRVDDLAEPCAPPCATPAQRVAGRDRARVRSVREIEPVLARRRASRASSAFLVAADDVACAASPHPEGYLRGARSARGRRPRARGRRVRGHRSRGGLGAQAAGLRVPGRARDACRTSGWPRPRTSSSTRIDVDARQRRFVG